MGATHTSASRPKSADVLITEAVRLAKPLDTLTCLAEARRSLAATTDRLHSATHHAIVAARATEPPATWPEIGTILGVSAQRAQQLARPV